MDGDTRVDGLHDPGLQQRLQALQRRGRRWLNAFFALAFGTWAWAMWLIFAEPFSSWWLLPPVLLLIATGAVTVGEITGLAAAYRREVLGPLYAQVFGPVPHDPDVGLDAETLKRAGLFPALYGPQRHEMHDRLVLDHQGLPLVLREAAVWIPSAKENNKPDEVLFSGTLFELRARLPLSEPVVLLCGDTPAQPMPPAWRLDRMQRVKPGHPSLDGRIEVICTTPSQARAALPLPVLQALARFVERHPGAWRVVLDGQGLVGGLDGPRLTPRIHPKAPLPDADTLGAHVRHLQTVLALVAALTEMRPLAPR